MSIFGVLILGILTSIVLLVGLVVAFDVLAWKRGVFSLSMRIWQLAREEPIFVAVVVLIVGILIGHLFWRIQY